MIHEIFTPNFCVENFKIVVFSSPRIFLLLLLIYCPSITCKNESMRSIYLTLKFSKYLSYVNIVKFFYLSFFFFYLLSYAKVQKNLFIIRHASICFMQIL